MFNHQKKKKKIWKVNLTDLWWGKNTSFTAKCTEKKHLEIEISTTLCFYLTFWNEWMGFCFSEREREVTWITIFFFLFHFPLYQQCPKCCLYWKLCMFQVNIGFVPPKKSYQAIMTLQSSPIFQPCLARKNCIHTQKCSLVWSLAKQSANSLHRLSLLGLRCLKLSLITSVELNYISPLNDESVREEKLNLGQFVAKGLICHFANADCTLHANFPLLQLKY